MWKNYIVYKNYSQRRERKSGILSKEFEDKKCFGKKNFFLKKEFS